MSTRRFASSGLILILLLAIIVPAAQAQKYSQPPNMGPSYSFASQILQGRQITTADDWICPDGAPIAGIRWWGSYWTPPAPDAFIIYSDGLNNAAAGGIAGFSIVIMANAVASPTMPYDHPDTMTVLGTWNFSLADVHETYVGTVQKSTNPSVTEDIYQYSVDFGSAPFSQQLGMKYWLQIRADTSTPGKQWGWHETATHVGSYAVQADTTAGSGVYPWYIPCGGHDMAFEFVTVPEPGSLLALAVGLTGLIGVAGRRRYRRF